MPDLALRQLFGSGYHCLRLRVSHFLHSFIIESIKREFRTAQRRENFVVGYKKVIGSGVNREPPCESPCKQGRQGLFLCQQHSTVQLDWRREHEAQNTEHQFFEVFLTLAISQTITYKILLLTCKALNGMA